MSPHRICRPRCATSATLTLFTARDFTLAVLIGNDTDTQAAADTLGATAKDVSYADASFYKQGPGYHMLNLLV